MAPSATQTLHRRGRFSRVLPRSSTPPPFVEWLPYSVAGHQPHYLLLRRRGSAPFPRRLYYVTSHSAPLLAGGAEGAPYHLVQLHQLVAPYVQLEHAVWRTTGKHRQRENTPTARKHAGAGWTMSAIASKIYHSPEPPVSLVGALAAGLTGSPGRLPSPQEPLQGTSARVLWVTTSCALGVCVWRVPRHVRTVR